MGEIREVNFKIGAPTIGLSADADRAATWFLQQGAPVLYCALPLLAGPVFRAIWPRVVGENSISDGFVGGGYSTHSTVSKSSEGF
jgi:hypothetical protein